MDITRRNFLFGSSAVLASIALTGCAKKNDEKPNSIMMALAYSCDDYTPVANWHVFDGLYNLDFHTNQIYNGLAAQNPIKLDDTNFEIILKDDMKFSDGSLCTCDDVIEAFNKNKTDSLFCGMLDPVESIKKVDNKILHIQTKYNCEDILKEILATFKITKGNLGTGPWAFSNNELKKIEFCKNPYCNGRYLASANNMTFYIEENDDERAKMLESKRVYAIENSQPKYNKILEECGAKVEFKPSGSGMYVLFRNLDTAARQAFMYSLDAQHMIDKYLNGKGSTASSFLPQYHESYNRASKVYSLDVAQAKKLLPVKCADIKVLVAKGLPAGIEDDITSNLEDVGFNPQVTVDSVDWENYDAVIFPQDPFMFAYNPYVVFDYMYGNNAWSNERNMFSKSPRYTEFRGYIENRQLNKCLDLISEELPIYPIYFRDHGCAYFQDKIKKFETINTTGLNVLR